MQRLGVPGPALQQRLVGCERLRELAVTVQLECTLECDAGIGRHAILGTGLSYTELNDMSFFLLRIQFIENYRNE
jgi:hypothetical protein